MKIEHIAIWVNDPEEMLTFYTRFFGGKPGTKYHNPAKGFESIFITFEAGPRIELMKQTNISGAQFPTHTGYAHLAFSLESRHLVDDFVIHLKEENIPVIDGPRITGDGYYEAVILDPEGNRIEICC